MTSNEQTRTLQWRGASILVLLLVAAAFIFRLPVQELWLPESSSVGAQPDHASAGAAQKAERKIAYWHDPMHPQYRSDKPGKAPDCGMDLVPVYAGGADAAQDMPEAAFRISTEKQQLIGVQYGEAAVQPLTKTIRTVGRLAFDETRIVRVHSKTQGWIERVFADFTGKRVEKNQPLLSIYSPELLATQEEYLLALRAQDKLGNSSFKEVAAGASSLLEAARTRLELWDVTAEQIAELEQRRKSVKAITLYSPASGFVIARNAYERQRVTPETELYTIADLSTIWVIADIYEFEAPLIREGQTAVLTLAHLPGRAFRGKITYIYPQLDNATRTLKVRMELPNSDFALKPEMYANVELRMNYGRQLTVPQEAVLDSGSEQVVFVARENGYFEGRRVQLGAKVDDRYIILGGLKAGERIVTSGNFLIDSESRLKSALTGMGMPAMNHGAGSGNQQQMKPSGQAPRQALPMDHSQHQTGAPQPGAMDHSRHQAMAGQHEHD